MLHVMILILERNCFSLQKDQYLPDFEFDRRTIKHVSKPFYM